MGCTSSHSNTALTSNPVYGGGGHQQGNASNKSNPLTEKEIQARIEAPSQTQVLELAGVTYRYAWMSQRGYYPESLDKENQDAFLIVPSFGRAVDQQAFFSVFDGHGRDGHHCARYARDHLGKNILDKFDRIPVGSMNSKTIKQALNVSHYLTNEAMHTDKRFDDSLSGTTAISMFIRGKTLYVSNVGDSRAIVVAQGEDGRLIAYPMSSDQTPYRKDERERVKKFGARVLSMDQIEGLEPVHENWGDLNLGEDIDEGGDPPRVWSPNGDYPGTAFTRSLGDLLAEECGVIPEPEILEREIKPNDRFIVIASDGVFEFLTNQMVADMLARYEDPLEACKAVVAASYELWLQYEVRTDDITIIAIYINDVRKSASFDLSSSFYTDGVNTKPSNGAVVASNTNPVTPATSLVRINVPDNQQTPPLSSDSRPVRRVISREKRKHLIQLKQDQDDGSEELTDADIAALTIPKTPEEEEILFSVMRSNFLFQHLNANQRNAVVSVMKALPVKAGEWIIKQGDAGDRFYVIESGRFEVRVKPMQSSSDKITSVVSDLSMSDEEKERIGGAVVHVYESGVDQHPGFGELSLMYGKPRAASVIALADGKLWSLDRKVFRGVVLRPKDYRRDILKTLKKVELLKCLNVTQMQRLIDLLNEASFRSGDYVIRQGEPGDTFYLLVSGQCDCTINQPDGNPPKVVMQLKEESYFGERALLESKPRAANVIAVTDIKVLYIGKTAFEEVLGPLAQIIDEDRARREAAAAAKLSAPHNLSELSIEGIALTDPLGPISIGQVISSKKEITLRSFILNDIIQGGFHDSVTRYVEASKAVHSQESAVLPKVISIIRQPNALHVVFPTTIVADLSTFIRTHMEGLSQAPSYLPFTMACIVSALEYLHESSIVYRAIQPESIYVDSRGKVVLLEYRFSKIGLYGNTRAFTLCGASDYLSPEQISQIGHSYPVDLWAMGVLLYELTVGSHPFSSTSEVATYNKISSFGTKAFSALKFPENLGTDVKSLINQLLVPTPEARIGAGLNGFLALKKHPFFKDIEDWDSFHTKNQNSPLSSFTKIEKDEIVSEGMDDKILASFSDPVEGDLSWLGNVEF
eukprot:gene11259-12558_t